MSLIVHFVIPLLDTVVNKSESDPSNAHISRRFLSFTLNICFRETKQER